MKTYINETKEIIVDNFAGGGGASTGIEMAIGRSVDVAINHDPVAIAMHRVNHPLTKHYCEDVYKVDPREAAAGRPVALAWFSPDCKHFSKAKGGTPVDRRIRGLAWIAVRWAATAKPKVIMLENVEEFATWGPLLPDNRPDPQRKGRTFRAFVSALRRHGYQVEWRELRASDYGSPTIRKRLFLVARRDGRPIVWPQPTHGDPQSVAVKSGRLQPWRVAAEIIDWSLPCPSIFERQRPLAENTRRRIARGIQRFVVASPSPFVVQVNHGRDDFRGQSVDEPMQTITAKNGWGLVSPTLMVNTTGHLGSKVNEPLRTVTTGNHHALVTAMIGRQFGQSVGHAADDPLGTVTAGGMGKSQLVTALLAEHAVEETKSVLAVPHITKFRGGATGHPVDEPLHTITSGAGATRPAGAAHAMGVATAFLAKHYGGNYAGPGADLREPAPTVTTVDHNSLVTSHLIKLRGTCQHGQSVADPMPTVTAGGNHIGEVRALLSEFNETAVGSVDGEQMQLGETGHRFGLVTIEGCQYVIVDIGMRMLAPHELFAAQGFPQGYIIDRDDEGNRFSKAAQVAACGNSVPPQLSEVLVRANLPELCTNGGADTVPAMAVGGRIHRGEAI